MKGRKEGRNKKKMYDTVQSFDVNAERRRAWEEKKQVKEGKG